MSVLALEATNLSCGYGRFTALEGVHLDVPKGHCVALLGRNGSGKSTLLRTMVGELKPLSGDLRVMGEPFLHLDAPTQARLVAFVPQEEPHEFPFLVREVVAMGRVMGGGLFDDPDDQRATQESMVQADCIAYADRPVTRLSGGERQRVLIARALCQQAPVLLMDEPAAHLDVEHQAALVHIVRSLVKEGRTVVIAVHDLNLALALADLTVLLDNGRVAAFGPTADVLEEAAVERVFRTPFDRWQTANQEVRLLPRLG